MAILKLIGFRESIDQQTKQTVLILPANLSTSYMKSQKMDLDAQINMYLMNLNKWCQPI